MYHMSWYQSNLVLDDTALVEAAVQGWDGDTDIVEEDVFGTVDQAVAIRRDSQDLAPPSCALLLKAIASYPELIKGCLDVLHFHPPPVSEADFESYHAKLQACIAALPEDAPPKRKIMSRANTVDVLLPNPHARIAHVDHRWNVMIIFEHRHWHFHGDLKALGCDMAGRMLYIGKMMAQESIWLGLVPMHVYNNPSHIGDVELGKRSMTMHPSLTRACYAGLLHVMELSRLRDAVLVQGYPDITSDTTFAGTCDLR
ncbi:hypothetical protein C8Q77DRAFT_1155163 [Trametes polyzona]|nr:hypothetical protein C8Q77DRAFT_1155163 [Trametes polyzona]